MDYPYHRLYYYLEHYQTPKEMMESNKVKMDAKAKKESEKYRLIKK